VEFTIASVFEKMQGEFSAGFGTGGKADRKNAPDKPRYLSLIMTR
jgi:hypothetical protein